ncbi:hypothetical protein GCM10009639_38020 [Kitasatospora putterlickiae]|uniref:DUF7691 domain-containing protein n=1 Tax=Kitasatospora putterlickiae TaxID=221725 RepID=A0ABP4ITV3_9ACTN
MSEQYLSAFAVDGDALLRTVGSGGEAFVRAGLDRIGPLAAAGRLLRTTEPAEVEAALREIATGRLDPSRPAGYTWLLELLLPGAGDTLGAATLPGRGWHELADTFEAWGLPALAGLWTRPWPFPWPGSEAPDADPWPFPSLAAGPQLDRVRAELAGFDLGRIHEEPELLPGGDEDAAEEVEWLVGELLPAWTAGALERGRGLLLLRDGGK